MKSFLDSDILNYSYWWYNSKTFIYSLPCVQIYSGKFITRLKTNAKSPNKDNNFLQISITYLESVLNITYCGKLSVTIDRCISALLYFMGHFVTIKHTLIDHLEAVKSLSVRKSKLPFLQDISLRAHTQFEGHVKWVSNAQIVYIPRLLNYLNLNLSASVYFPAQCLVKYGSKLLPQISILEYFKPSTYIKLR